MLSQIPVPARIYLHYHAPRVSGINPFIHMIYTMQIMFEHVDETAPNSIENFP